MEIGIVGMPNAGKTTLFNALTRVGAKVSLYPFCTVEPNEGLVAIPDERLEVLAKIFNQSRVVPGAIKFVDLAGLVKGAHSGEGLGNQFLGYIREVDALLHLVRCFEDEKVAHVAGGLDLCRDIEIVNIELILADLAAVEKRLEGVRRKAKSGGRRYLLELGLLERLREHLNRGLPARQLAVTDEERDIISELFLLTMKPVIYVPNIGEGDVGDEERFVVAVRDLVRDLVGDGDIQIIPISAKIEAEIAELGDEEAQVFRKELGLEEVALDRLIKASQRLLGLITFFTGVGKELRAWTIVGGTKAVKAAGKIHSDMERGFIKAEVIGYEKLVEAGSWAGAQERGWLRMEGKDYIVEDGDIICFKFR